MQYSISLLLVSILACGCATTSRVTPRISTGMTKQEVLSVCGNPFSTEARADNLEVLVYKESIYDTSIGQMTMNPADTLYTYITLENGKVIRYNTEKITYQSQPVSPQAQAAILGMYQQQNQQLQQNLNKLNEPPKTVNFGGESYGYTKYDYGTGEMSSGSISIRESGMQVIKKE
jgi:hypothetical protein